MSLIPEILGRRGSLVEQALFPNLFASAPTAGASPQAGPASPPASPAIASAPARRPGLRGILEQIFTGAADPRLSGQENDDARRMALIQGGLATMAASQQPGATALGSVAQGAMFGQQAREQQAEMIYGRTAAERIQNALNDPAVTAKLTPEQRAMISLLPPGEAVKMLSELAFRQVNPVVVGEGSALVGPDGTVLHQQAPKPGELSADFRTVLFANGYDPDDMTPAQKKAAYQEWQAIQPKGSNPVVNVNLPGDTQEGMNKIGLGLYEQMDASATNAMGTLNSLGVMESLLQEGMPTGRLEAATTGLRGLGVSLGLMNEEESRSLSQQQLFQAFGNRLALSQKDGMPGPLSDNDIKFLKEMVPSLANTVEGNRLMIEVLRRFEQRKIQMADLAEQYVQEKGNTIGLRRHINSWATANPMSFSDLYNVGDPSWGAH